MHAMQRDVKSSNPVVEYVLKNPRVGAAVVGGGALWITGSDLRLSAICAGLYIAERYIVDEIKKKM